MLDLGPVWRNRARLRVARIQAEHVIMWPCCGRWRRFVDDAPQCVQLSSVSELGPNLSYTHSR